MTAREIRAGMGESPGRVMEAGSGEPGKQWELRRPMPGGLEKASWRKGPVS